MPLHIHHKVQTDPRTGHYDNHHHNHHDHHNHNYDHNRHDHDQYDDQHNLPTTSRTNTRSCIMMIIVIMMMITIEQARRIRCARRTSRSDVRSVSSSKLITRRCHSKNHHLCRDHHKYDHHKYGHHHKYNICCCITYSFALHCITLNFALLWSDSVFQVRKCYRPLEKV